MLQKFNDFSFHELGKGHEDKDELEVQLH